MEFFNIKKIKFWQFLKKNKTYKNPFKKIPDFVQIFINAYLSFDFGPSYFT